MDSHLQQSMLRYYDERAPEYEEAYLLGTGTASIPDPNLFRAEALLLGHIVERVAVGRLIDLACGSATIDSSILRINCRTPNVRAGSGEPFPAKEQR